MSRDGARWQTRKTLHQHPAGAHVTLGTAAGGEQSRKSRSAYLQQRVHPIVHGHVQPADFVHHSLRYDHVGEGSAAAGALQEVDLVEDTVGIEDCKRY